MTEKYNPLEDVTLDEIAVELRRRKLGYVFGVADRTDPFAKPRLWVSCSDPVEGLGLLALTERYVMEQMEALDEEEDD